MDCGVSMDRLATGVHGGFSAVAVVYLQEAVVAMIPWALCMFAVIACDLFSALRRCWLMGEELRLSRAVRATMGKTVTYFSFVLMVCMMETAAGGTLHIDRWACLVVCAVELSSVLGNILRPKGYSADVWKAVCRALGISEIDKKEKE